MAADPEIEEVVQGKQGDFKNPMTMLESIQQKLQMIGSKRSEDGGPSPGKDDDMLGLMAEEVTPEQWEQEATDVDDYYRKLEEQSVIYKDQKVFDQPQRAMYGIKKAGKLF